MNRIEPRIWNSWESGELRTPLRATAAGSGEFQDSQKPCYADYLFFPRFELGTCISEQ